MPTRDDMEEMDNLADFEMGGPDTMDGKEDDEKSSAPFNTNDKLADQIMHYYRHFNSDSMMIFKIIAMAAGHIELELPGDGVPVVVHH